MNSEGESCPRRGPTAEADENSGSSSAHQVQGRGVRRCPAHNDRHVQLVNEFLQIQRFAVSTDVFCTHRGSTNHKEVNTRGENGF